MTAPTDVYLFRQAVEQAGKLKGKGENRKKVKRPGRQDEKKAQGEHKIDNMY